MISEKCKVGFFFFFCFWVIFVSIFCLWATYFLAQTELSAQCTEYEVVIKQENERKEEQKMLAERAVREIAAAVRIQVSVLLYETFIPPDILLYLLRDLNNLRLGGVASSHGESVGQLRRFVTLLS